VHGASATTGVDRRGAAGDANAGDPRAGQPAAREAEACTLAAAAATLGLPLEPEQIAALQSYLDLMQQWNGTYNLTAVRERGEMLNQHLADCLALLAPLERHAVAGRLLDVGSGGGLPGGVIAVARPAWDVTCVDAVAKKAAFVRQVAGQLRLVNLRAVHARVEAVKAPVFDVIVARAFATLAELVRLSEPLLAPGGIWLAMKGREPAAEIAALPSTIEVFHVERLAVPGLAAERCLVWMRRRER
jgi:16S rRNA (guanine527-N7)-methyltransferase